MELRHLRYFVAVAQESHLGRAAARLRVAPSALSRQLRDLERELGVELFARQPRGLQLTEAGHAYLAHAQRTLAAADEGARAARTAARGVTGRVRVGLPDWGDRVATIGRGLDVLRREHPGVVIEFDPTPWVVHEAALRARTIDVGFSAGAGEEDYGADVAAEWLAPEAGNSALVSASHPAATSPTLRLADLRGVPLLLPPRDANPVLYDRTVATVRRRGGYEPRVDASSLSAAAAAMAVAAGVGWMITFASLDTSTPPGTVLRTLADVSEVLGFFALRRRDDDRAVVRTLIAHVRAAFAAVSERASASANGADTGTRAGEAAGAG